MELLDGKTKHLVVVCICQTVTGSDRIIENEYSQAEFSEQIHDSKLMEEWQFLIQMLLTELKQQMIHPMVCLKYVIIQISDEDILV